MYSMVRYIYLYNLIVYCKYNKKNRKQINISFQPNIDMKRIQNKYLKNAMLLICHFIMSVSQ